MKIPQFPPDYDEVISVAAREPEKLPRILTLEATDAKDRYLHWEEFRFKPQPEGLTAEQAWAGTKLARLKQSTTIPLTAENGRAFRFMETNSMRREMSWLDSNASGNLLTSMELNDKAIGRSFRVSTLIEEAFSSSLLEGAATTREIAKQMIKAGRPPETKSERMVLNNYHAMQFIGQHKSDPLSIDMIRELHRIVTNGTLDREEMAGVIRGPADKVVVEDTEGNVLHEPPAAGLLPSRLKRICDFANHDFTKPNARDGNKSIFIHPIIQAIALHFMIGYDHPFVDGNGRTARALFYWLMIRHGYWLMEFTSISKTLVKAPRRYGRAYLDVETDDFDLTYFCLHQIEVLRNSVAALQDHLKKKAQEISDLEGRLLETGFDHELNYRQIDLLKKFVERPGIVVTIQEHQREYGSSYQTARTDLLTLEERGLLARRKVGKAFAFVAPRDLQARLEKNREPDA